MSGELGLAVAGALWLGILTSISPCPLATNLAAVSFIGRKLGHPMRVFGTGILYAAGRMSAYTALALILVGGLRSSSELARLLDAHMNKVLGPVLIVTAMFLLNLISFNANQARLGERAQALAERGGLVTAYLLGVLFALALCPVSAAIFFGSLIPLALATQATILLPSLYGLGTALPVLGLAAVLAFGASSLGNVYANVRVIEKWARLGTGLLFLGLGFYYTLAYVFEVI